MLINPDIVICPGCAKVWDNLEQYKKDTKCIEKDYDDTLWVTSGGECPNCNYENGMAPYRLLTIEELKKDETTTWHEVSLGKFLNVILILMQIYIDSEKRIGG